MVNEYPGVYCTEHIIFLVLFIIMATTGIFIVLKCAKSEKIRGIIVKISAAILLALIVTNRVSVTFAQIKTEPETYSWLNLLPYTFCGLASLVYSLSALLGKDDNTVYHFIVYFGFFGGLAALLYPDFLDTQTFWDIRTTTGLLHHAMMIWLTALLIATGKFRPNAKKWYVYPVGFCLMMVLGIFEIDALGFREAMNIGKPLVGSLTVLTSWYVIGAVSSVIFRWMLKTSSFLTSPKKIFVFPLFRSVFFKHPIHHPLCKFFVNHINLTQKN